MTEPVAHIVIAGCPNAGKTALFNRLTGSHQKVANYAGVTVEYKTGHLTTPAGRHVHVYDVPGAYSLQSQSPDEEIARNVMKTLPDTGKAPDLIVCVADAANLALHVRFALELKTLGIPMVLALNMADIARRYGLALNASGLSEILKIPVVETVAVRRGEVADLLATLDGMLAAPQSAQAQAHIITPPPVQDLSTLHKQAQSALKSAGMRNGVTPTSTHIIDRILLHPILGITSLLVIMFTIFQAVFSFAEWPMDQIDGFMGALGALVSDHLPDGYIKSFIVDAVIAGVGSVVIFLPQILILFFFILILEDSGYMARAAFLLDKLMGHVGLNGRAFIPLLSSFACAIPGIMATRTIASRRDRLVTMLIAPLMTCSARIPVYTLIIAAFIPPLSIYGFNLQGIVMFALYASAVVFGLIVAAVMKRTMMARHRTHFMLELPSYKLPSARNLLFGLIERAKIFLRRAGTIIFTVTVILWFLASFPVAPAGAENPVTYSAAGMIGQALAPIFAPIGFNWQMVIALIPGLAAREVAVAALGTVYSISDAGSGIEQGLAETLSNAWSLPTALAFLAWYIFAPQCISTLAVLRREAGSSRWMWVAVAYLTGLAYIAAGLTYHISLWLLS